VERILFNEFRDLWSYCPCLVCFLAFWYCQSLRVATFYVLNVMSMYFLTSSRISPTFSCNIITFTHIPLKIHSSRLLLFPLLLPLLLLSLHPPLEDVLLLA
jgi:hypothetical protein